MVCKTFGIIIYCLKYSKITIFDIPFNNTGVQVTVPSVYKIQHSVGPALYIMIITKMVNTYNCNIYHSLKRG